MALLSGTKLGPYEIQSSLGAGGMGEVYRARDTRLERDVAVKVLPANLSSDPSSRQRLEREAKAVSKLSHPHISVSAGIMACRPNIGATGGARTESVLIRSR